MTTRIRYQVVDAFTARPFSGNPAAVVWLDQPLDSDLCRQIAAEFNLSETAFLLTLDTGRYQLRWFTPTAEVALCGHATLAAGHLVLPLNSATNVIFETASGDLIAIRNPSSGIDLDFPARHVESVLTPDPLFDCICPGWQSVFRAGDDWMVVMPSEHDVYEIVPDPSVICQLPGRGLIVTAASADSAVDCVSRFFAPNVGIVEDPVTGSAHCALAPYWQGILGKDSIVGRQLSQRGGVVKARYRGDRVILSGECATVMEGFLWV